MGSVDVLGDAPESAGARPAVQVRNLSKVFETASGTTTALQSTDLELARAEFVCVVGPSGCGKTTLLNIIAGLERQSTGEIVFGELPPDRPTLSVVFQEQSVFPWLTVLDNAAFGLKARGVPKAERRRVALGMIERMGLGRFAHSYPHELSGGMRQRVNIARAFANDPHVLLMDEPFGALDEQTKLLMQDELLAIWEGSNKTVLFITHSIDEAIRLADRVVVMSARPGRVKTILPVPIPRPRHVLEMQSDERFVELRAAVWELLREEVVATHNREVEGGGS
ncbi:mannosyltransferase [Prauserella sp. PE36]|nr:mannosyltransferase [Prauserella sp. PE36]